MSNAIIVADDQLYLVGNRNAVEQPPRLTRKFALHPRRRVPPFIARF